jgi:predicted DNA-binding WGR domain protein
MSEQWDVHLVFTDARSNKFWRARVEGGALHINYGRVGTDGQTSVKDLGTAAAATAALAKQADGKRRKGYEDGGGAAPAAPAEAAPAVPAGPRTVELVRGGERQVAVRLTCDGAVVRTEVTETYGSPAEAAAAFARILEAMSTEGYKAKP